MSVRVFRRSKFKNAENLEILYAFLINCDILQFRDFTHKNLQKVLDMTDQNKTDHISWTKGQVAQIQAAFFYGYCSSCALFGLFADRVGPRIIIGETYHKTPSSELF